MSYTDDIIHLKCKVPFSMPIVNSKTHKIFTKGTYVPLHITTARNLFDDILTRYITTKSHDLQVYTHFESNVTSLQIVLDSYS